MNKTILITGMTGSLGTAVSKRLIKEKPKRLICLSRDWHKQLALKTKLKDPKFVRWFIGDVRDVNRLKLAMKDVDIVIHAAAIKEVGVCENDSFEAVQTNVIGTENVISAAIYAGVKKVLVISSDKSAQSANTYGKTKALAESLAVASNIYTRKTETKISAVRYGNVIGSSGSVVPLFKEQAKNHLVTITDKRMTRFWITMDDAVDFVLNCVKVMKGGEIFVPQLKSAYIKDLAAAIAPGSTIRIIGKRPGEKLHEIMITCEESSHTKKVDNYFVIEPENPQWNYKPIKANLVAKDWCYSSDNNSDWFTIKDLMRLTK